MNVAVVYHSQTGYTKLLAEAVYEGVAAEGGVGATLHEIEPKHVVEGRYENEELLGQLDAAQAIVFGTPTHMGSVSAPMKAFLDATLQRFYSRAWSDKVASAFTVSSTPSGDKLQALMTIATCAMQLGMIWVGQERTPLNAEGINRLSIYFGAGGQALYGGQETAIFAEDRATGVLHGARVARIARAIALGSEIEAGRETVERA